MYLLVVGDKANEMTSGASKEANKNVAKDDNASLGTRASAAKDAAGDKLDETKNSVCFHPIQHTRCRNANNF